jgi:deoxyribonuclease V
MIRFSVPDIDLTREEADRVLQVHGYSPITELHLTDCGLTGYSRTDLYTKDASGATHHAEFILREIWRKAALALATQRSDPMNLNDTLETQGDLEDCQIEKARYNIQPTGDRGVDSGRPRYRVTCLACGAVVHENTAGPVPLIKQHNSECRNSLEEARKRARDQAKRIQTGVAWKYLAGVCCTHDPDKRVVRATAVLLSASNWAVIKIKTQTYGVPPWEELRCFRDGSAMAEVVRKLSNKPDLIFAHGHGQADPNKFGAACYVGLQSGIPTIGIDTTYPAGIGEPNKAMFNSGAKRGDMKPITHQRETLGYELVTQDEGEPIYVSIGDRLSLDDAVGFTLKAAPVWRLPEPLRKCLEIHQER